MCVTAGSGYLRGMPLVGGEASTQCCLAVDGDDGGDGGSSSLSRMLSYAVGTEGRWADGYSQNWW